MISTGFSQIKLAFYEDSLKNLGEAMVSDTIQDNRFKANYTFIQTLVTALKEKNSFYYPFNQLNDFMSVRKTDDNKFRIFSWFTLSDQGEYRYYGALQVNNPNKLELYHLLDNTPELRKAENLADTVLTTKQWYGAVYYQIVSVTGVRNPYYLLLGWKGKSATSNSKLIETLRFVDDKPVFGTQVLQQKPKSDQFASRMIFDYTKQATMMLSYVKADNLFVFDHLVSLDKPAEGIPELFAPDLSYDGLI